MTAKRHEPIAATAASGSAQIEYISLGEGPAVVLLPGGSLSSSYLAPLAEHIAATGRRAIRINPRGTGNSTGADEPGITLHTLAGDVAAVIAALDLPHADIAGHAFGNRVARCLANDRSELVRSVICLAAGGTVPPTPAAAHAMQLIFADGTPEQEILSVLTEMTSEPAKNAEVWKVLGPARSGKAGALQRSANAATDPGDWTRPRTSVPFLVIQGSDDHAAPPANGELLKQQLGDQVTLASIEGAGHLMLLTDPELTTRAIVDFLAGLDATA